jgi:YidC/Oxa1 family membrane protein insertase
MDINPSVPMSDEGHIVVKTDLYRINIGKKGGGIDKLELLKFPVALERPDVPTLLLNNTAPLFYVAQGGLLSENGGPTHEVMFTTANDNYSLGDEEGSLIVPLVWENEDGLKVTKTYVSHSLHLHRRGCFKP